MSMISELQVSSVVIISFVRHLITKTKTVAEHYRRIQLSVIYAFIRSITDCCNLHNMWVSKILSIQVGCILSMKVL